jgi:tripartite ATP-independent transporter DctP family solute receptor
MSNHRSSLSRGGFLVRGAAASAAAFTGIGILRSPASAAARYQFKLGHVTPETFPLHKACLAAADAIRRESGGKIDIQVFPNSQLGGDTAMLSQVRSGAMQFYPVTGSILDTVVPISAMEGVGFAFTSTKDAYAAMDGALGEQIRKEAPSRSMIVFEKPASNGFRQVTTSTKPIKSVDDFAHLKIRTIASKMQQDLFSSLGASPTPISFNELYTAMQTHVVDAQENPYALIEQMHFYEVQKYVSVTNHMWSGYWFVMNQDAYNGLPPNLKDVVRRNFNQAALAERVEIEKVNEQQAALLRKQGLVFNTPDTEPMRARLKDFYARCKSEFGSSAWAALESVTGKLA